MQITVAVPSHDRPERLAALLDALAAQTLPAEQWEAVVCHDSAGDAGRRTRELLAGHELAAAGRLREIALDPGPGPAAKRNLAWRAGSAPLVVFTDDDCRPSPGWLEALLRAAQQQPGAIVQGSVKPDPDEAALLAAPLARTQDVDPPSPWVQTANVAYPRAVLEAAGGFDEQLPVAAGEDTDLALRAQAAGAPLVAAPDALVWHAVDALTLRQAVRTAWRWRHLALVARRHPEVRRHIPAGIFWKASHPWLLLALAGALLAIRFPPAVLLTIPWLRHLQRRGGLRTLPLRAVVDVAELAAMLAGSVRHRTVLL